MPYLIPEEITTHLYGEVINEINRNDENNLIKAIEAAIAEAESYLTAYDTEAIFSASGNERNSIILLYIKDITVWHYIQLSNPAVDMQLRLDRYDNAIKFLEKVQAGKANPKLPLPDPADNADNIQAGETFVKWGGNIKRHNHY
jgi:phage gp36-like protein